MTLMLSIPATLVTPGVPFSLTLHFTHTDM